MPQCLSGNAVVSQMPSGRSIPTGMFCASRRRQRTWGKSDFFDSGGVLRLFRRLRAKFLRISLKGKPRDLDYPACWTGARRCAPKSDCAPVPPNGKKGARRDSNRRSTTSCQYYARLYPLGHCFACGVIQKYHLWIWSLRRNFLKKTKPPAEADGCWLFPAMRRGCRRPLGPPGTSVELQT